MFWSLFQQAVRDACAIGQQTAILGTMYASQRRRLLLTFLTVLCGMLVAMIAARHLVEQSALRDESASVRQQLHLYAQALQQRVDRYRILLQILAMDPDLRAAVSGPLSPAQVDALNRKLERANNLTQSSTLTLINHDGVALAASNWRAPRSNVGVDHAFRPYYQQALNNGSGSFYGIGMITSKPGYFLSQAIVEGTGKVQGVVVIKIALADLEREWRQTPDIVLASDVHSVVFLASQPQWRYRVLAPLSERDRRELQSTRQYADQELLPLQHRVIEQTGDGGVLTDIRDRSLTAQMLWQTLELPENGWHLHLLHDTRASAAAGRAAAIAAAGAWLALALLWLFVQQQRRLSALRQRSRHELETLLQQHAEELRTAQDGLITAAQQANAGLSRSLEHLPQGVVIIDEALNLVAWNSRYVELFRFPSELLKIGRPIEDLFRFNARRGLLGPGPIEAAIERRLHHLRSGKPHLRESEKEDGTVLEIRGNPLPDGGFVTSYADITSYKNAARELRSLADALEHRVAERTRDLAAAKRDAENANRYKTRFVASAVHDLLQPLNAARMFLSVLRGQVHEAGDARIIDNIDGALAAQDAILNSLLDITRLEAGSLKSQVRDFALAPLLETLAREFSILAADRGLLLESVPTSAVVLSDEALLRRILQNFLSNAIRYTPRGRVLIGCRRRGSWLRIEVHDQGPGIPDAFQQEIFEEFRRLDNGIANDRGAGLGLAIVERIGRLLGHRIGLRSNLGAGSVFWVTVPLGERATIARQLPVPASTVDHGNDPILHGCRIWCVDDDPLVCEATRTLLERWECRVDFAGIPDEALSAANADEIPELLLLDVRMGAHDGLTLVQQLVEHWQREPRVILVTAETDPVLREHARDLGWGFLLKPVRPPALRALVTQMLMRRG